MIVFTYKYIFIHNLVLSLDLDSSPGTFITFHLNQYILDYFLINV